MALTITTVQAGGQVTVNGTYFPDSQMMTVYLDDEGTSLGSAAADGTGNFTFTAAVPKATAAGDHNVCVALTPQPYCVALQVLPAPSPSPVAHLAADPPTVPISPAALLLAAVSVAAVGGIIMLLARRRRQSMAPGPGPWEPPPFRR